MSAPRLGIIPPVYSAPNYAEARLAPNAKQSSGGISRMMEIMSSYCIE